MIQNSSRDELIELTNLLQRNQIRFRSAERYHFRTVQCQKYAQFTTNSFACNCGASVATPMCPSLWCLGISSMQTVPAPVTKMRLPCKSRLTVYSLDRADIGGMAASAAAIVTEFLIAELREDGAETGFNLIRKPQLVALNLETGNHM